MTQGTFQDPVEQNYLAQLGLVLDFNGYPICNCTTRNTILEVNLAYPEIWYGRVGP